MNDTPRTDAQINGNPCTRFAILAGYSLREVMVPSDFARELERENAQLRAIGAELRKSAEMIGFVQNAQLRAIGAELRKSAEMIGFVQSADTWRDAQRRIKAWDALLANTKVTHAEENP